MDDIFQALREVIEAAPVSRYRMAKDLEIDQSVLSRFMSGEIGLTVQNVEKVADYLGYKIVLQPKAGKPARRKKGNEHGDNRV